MANLVAMLRLPDNFKSTQWEVLAGPVLILLILSMMVLPLPAFVLDLLFTFNIALSIMVLLVAMFTQPSAINVVGAEQYRIKAIDKTQLLFTVQV